MKFIGVIDFKKKHDCFFPIIITDEYYDRSEFTICDNEREDYSKWDISKH